MKPYRAKRGSLLIKLALLGLAVGLVVFALVRTEREPEYRGRPLREWLDGSANPAAVQEAIRAMGTNSLPFLIGYLRAKDPPFHNQWVRLKARLGLRKGGADARLWKLRAAQACGLLGQDAAPAIPAMIEAMNHGGVADMVAITIPGMLPKGTPMLTNVLASGSGTARTYAAILIGEAAHHPTAEQMARTALLNALQDPEITVRLQAADTLGCWTNRLDLLVPTMARALNDPNAKMRGAAAACLGRFGDAAQLAVPELLKLLRDTNDISRKSAKAALWKIDPTTAAKAAANQL